MKKIIIFLFLLLSMAIIAQDIQELYNKQDFIRLAHLNIENYDLQQLPNPLLKAQTYSAMSQYEKSNKELQNLLKTDSILQNPELMIEILFLQASNYSNTYQYKQAAESYKKTLDNYGDLLGEIVAPLQDAYQRYKVLSKVKPLQISLLHDTQIKTSSDKKGLPLVQVRTAKDSVSLVFDTGAGMSCVTQSVAKKLGIQILFDSLMVGGATGNIEFMSIGVADTLLLGNILYQNVVFGIFEDEKLTFPEHNYAINGTLGFPEMRILPTIKIHKNGMLEISKSKDKHKSNMMFSDGNQIIIQANDSLLLWLDTGSVWSEVSVNYFNKNKEQIIQTGKQTVTTMNGIGGSEDFAAYTLQNFPIKIANTSIILPEITVFTQPIMDMFEYDGTLGQDVISQYDYMVLNFRDMYFSLGNDVKE